MFEVTPNWRGERVSATATHRRRAEDQRSGLAGTLAALHDCARRAHRAGLARGKLTHPAGDDFSLASGRLPRPLATTLSAFGTAAYVGRSTDPGNGGAQPALGRRAHSRRTAQARHPRLQADRSTVHAPLPAQRWRQKLVDLPAQTTSPARANVSRRTTFGSARSSCSSSSTSAAEKSSMPQSPMRRPTSGARSRPGTRP